jgi:hypothetical protein
LLTVRNTTSNTVDITHPSGCPAMGWLYNDGSPVSVWPYGCAAVVTPDTLDPGQTKQYPVELTTQSRDPSGTSVRPGPYDAAAGLALRNNTTWFAPPVRVEVTA